MNWLVLLWTLSLFTLNVRTASATDEDPKKDWMQYYYQSPSPDKVPTEMYRLQREGALRKDSASYPLSAFFARLFAANPQKLELWISCVRGLPEAERKPFIVALRWADTPTAAKELDNMVSKKGDFGRDCARIRASVPPDFKTMREPSPQQLDACWASFFATGDKDYVLTVIRCAAKCNTRILDSSQLSALWSLKNLSQTHPAIVGIKDEFYKAASDREKEALDKFLADPKPPRQDPAPTMPEKLS